MSLILRNPHSVLAVLKTRPQDVLEVSVAPKANQDAWERVIQEARVHRIPVKQKVESKGKGGRDPASSESTRMGAAEAVVKEREPVSLEALFKDAPQRAQGAGIWLALDCLQDPHNVGAIFRTAAFFGVQGIVLTQERSAPLTPVVYDVASGGLEYVPFSSQVNLKRSLDTAKELGVWILGTSEHAQDSIQSIASDRPWLLVVGNEERGIRRLTEESCDVLCRIPSLGSISSLNVSSATAIALSKLIK